MSELRFVEANHPGLSSSDLLSTLDIHWFRTTAMTRYTKRVYFATKRMTEDMLICNMAITTIDAYTSTLKLSLALESSVSVILFSSL